MKDKERSARERMEEARKQALASDITADFLRRQEERRPLDRRWQVDINFLGGDQYCGISPRGEVESEEAAYYWQSRGVFNHIAPTVDARLARLSKVRPSLCVRAFSDSPEDVKTARLCSNILKAVKGRIGLDRIVARATLWSEACGTAFYKIVWEGSREGGAGTANEGDVGVVALPPFEVYPDSLSAESLEDVKSLIHAKAMQVTEIAERYGVELAGRSGSRRLRRAGTRCSRTPRSSSNAISVPMRRIPRAGSRSRRAACSCMKDRSRTSTAKGESAVSPSCGRRVRSSREASSA